MARTNSTHGLKMRKIRAPNGKMKFVTEGLDEDSSALAVADGHTVVPFTPGRADWIVERYTEGLSLSAISRLPNAPPLATIMSWKAKRPDFAIRIREAKKNRGLVHEEMALQIAAEATEDNLGVAKLQVDTHKWAAEVSDPETYGKRKNEGGGGNVTVVVNTGVPDSEVDIEVKASTPVEAVSVEAKSVEDLL